MKRLFLLGCIIWAQSALCMHTLTNDSLHDVTVEFSCPGRPGFEGRGRRLKVKRVLQPGKSLKDVISIWMQADPKRRSKLLLKVLHSTFEWTPLPEHNTARILQTRANPIIIVSCEGMPPKWD